MNRIKNDLDHWKVIESNLSNLFESKIADPIIKKHKLKFFNEVLAKDKGGLNLEERATRDMVKKMQKDLTKQLYENRGVAKFFRAVFKPIRYIRNRFIAKTTQKKVEVNHQLLKDQMIRLGFGGSLNALHQALKGNENSFTINDNRIQNKTDHISYNLSFSKDTDGQVQLDGYNTSLKKSDHGPVLTNYFSCKEESITALQAYNLLDGRAVSFKVQDIESDGIKTVIKKLDFNDQVNNSFKKVSFDAPDFNRIKKQIEQLPFVNEADKMATTRLFKNLVDGERTHARLIVNGKAENIFLNLDPVFGKIRFTDLRNQSVNLNSQGTKLVEMNKQSPAKNNRRNRQRKVEVA